jgi:cardiolipin synthase
MKITFLNNPKLVFEKAINLLSNAKKCIYFQMYKIQDDELGNQIKSILIDKAKHGIDVQIIYDRDSYIPSGWWDDLIKAGGKVHLYQKGGLFEKLTHEHTKMIIIDKAIIVGGVNFQNCWKFNWYDYDMLIENDLASLIEAKRHFYLSKTNIFAKLYIKPLYHSYNYKLSACFPISSQLNGYDIINKEYIDLLHLAKNNVILASWLFLPTRHIEKMLYELANDGVIVNVIVAQPDNFEKDKWTFFQKIGWMAQRYFLNKLQRRNIHVKICFNKYWHGKILTVDNKYAVFGSYNLNVIEQATKTSNICVATNNMAVC